jgi:hypothetical protein
MYCARLQFVVAQQALVRMALASNIFKSLNGQALKTPYTILVTSPPIYQAFKTTLLVQPFPLQCSPQTLL